jgi:hypothetical protein
MPETYATLYIDIDQPFASTLAAFGIARLADILLVQQVGERRRVCLEHQGVHYAIHLEPALDLSFNSRFPGDFLTLIATEKNSDMLPKFDGHEPWRYEQRKQQVSEYFELRKKLTPTELKAAPDTNPALARLQQLQPDTRWYGMAMINQMQALTAYNEIVATWLTCRAHWQDLFEIIIGLWGQLPNNLPAAIERWLTLIKQHGITAKENITASQTINPDQGKGANRAKADALTVGNQSSFWLLEAMKFAGVFVAALPRTVSGVKDRKTYVLLPKKIDFGTHRDIYTDFQEQLWPATAIKMDVLAALRYSHAFVKQFLAAQTHVPGEDFRPQNHVQGLATAYYKDLGSAVATMNMATINLPDWSAGLRGIAGARRLYELLEEQIAVIRVLDESKSDETALLHSYRDFLSSRDPQLSAFFDFTNRYATYVMGKILRRQPVRHLTISSLEVIIMSNDQHRSQKPLEPIIRTPGFQNIAEAIRRSTVIPQYQKRDDRSSYEVRYGLGDKLKRKAHYPLQFIQELSDFMHLYNQENARLFEKEGMQFRKSITTEDIAQVAALLDEYKQDAPAVAYLLIAYGYARDPKEREAPATPNTTGAATLPPDSTGDGASDEEDLPF